MAFHDHKQGPTLKGPLPGVGGGETGEGPTHHSGHKCGAQWGGGGLREEELQSMSLEVDAT